MIPDMLSIRSFAPDDLPILQEVRRAAFEPVFRSFREIVGPTIAVLALDQADAEQAKHLEDLCAAISDKSDVLVVTFSELVVGFVAYSLDLEKQTGEIGLNAVSPAYGGQGVGTWMYDHVMTLMKDRGMRLATVGTGGDASHAPARRAYEKAGFGPAIPSIYLYRLL